MAAIRITASQLQLGITKAILVAMKKTWETRSPREKWLMDHRTHQLEARDNHDYCFNCNSVFWRPN